MESRSGVLRADPEDMRMPLTMRPCPFLKGIATALRCVGRGIASGLLESDAASYAGRDCPGCEERKEQLRRAGSPS